MAKPSEYSKPRDWRSQYEVCEHVEKDSPNDSLRHRGFRVCCVACHDAGFLACEQMQYTELPNGLTIGRMVSK